MWVLFVMKFLYLHKQIFSILRLKESIFDRHHQYYKNIGIETILQQAGQIEQVSSDYQGRVIYELLQNAFDRADKRILVILKEDSLFIANDGIHFTYTADYDYHRGSLQRGDFQSLCSISTSTKNTAGSIGNKGVGFKSSFSIAREGFVNLYTKGAVVLQDSSIVQEHINFSVYEVFKNVSSISSNFSDQIKENILDKLDMLHHQRPDRGVPGFYFPYQLNQPCSTSETLLQEGYVTIVEIPIADPHYIETLILEMKNIHFQFVKLKYPDFSDRLKVAFKSEKHDFVKNIGKDDNFFSTIVEDERILQLAAAAKIEITSIEIGIYLRSNPGGLFYNYLPTQERSPFPYVDFHADFHTTVDRKSINYDGEVGRYNQALYRCCLEFYFALLKGQLSDDMNCSLNLRHIKKIKENQKFFFPSLLSIVDDGWLFDSVQDIMEISGNQYLNASIFLAGLAKEYFKTSRSISDHESFIATSMRFIEFFARGARQQYKLVDDFKELFGKQLLKNNAEIIPQVQLNEEVEILYRKKIEKKISVPEYLGVNIIDFAIEDETFRKALGVRDFSDSNEVLKFFKQCTFTGEYSTESISELDQQQQIRNIYSFFEMKNTQEYLTSHRFTRSHTRQGRDTQSVLNQANYNISTLFLKTLSGRYKPAQLCRKMELDLNFLPLVVDKDKLNNFLKFLGVSLDKTYFFADKRIHKELSKGLEYIPKFLKRSSKPEITAELILNFCIISDSDAWHPSLLNNNDYKFLYSITRTAMKGELDNLLVKNYASFPLEYKAILKEKLKKSLTYRSDIMRFYQTVYKMYEPEKFFLVCENNQLIWSDESPSFIIAGSKTDFELCCLIPDKKILCYYSVANLAAHLKSRVIIPHKGEIKIDNAVENKELKELINSKIIYILLSISYSKNSEVNYLDDDKDLTEVQNRLERLVIIEGSGLRQDIFFGTDNVISGKKYAYEDVKRENLYLEKSCNNRHTAEGISEFLFDNLSISESLELILFHKDISMLALEFTGADMAVLTQKWKADFNEKSIEFHNKILHAFDHTLEDDSEWFIYNQDHKSHILIEIDQKCRMDELFEYIQILKESDDFTGYFEGFEIVIDRSDIVRRISMLKLYADQSMRMSQEDKEKINELRPLLGIEESLNCFEELLKQEQAQINTEQLESKGNELLLSSRIDQITSAMPDFSKNINSTEFTGGKLDTLKSKKKTAVFLGADSLKDSSEFEAIGASGEEQVLIYFIQKFLELGIEQQKKGIEEIYNVLHKKIKKETAEKYRNGCLVSLGNALELSRALIPFFYVAMHAKFAYFDLIVYKNLQPTLIEVKTTYSESNNRFMLSSAEIDAARTEEFYEIVRVTPSTLNFLGNPIKLVEENLSHISGDNFVITPKNYEFRFK
ncbi:hypothetical protein DM790_22470 [Flavobacterium collinsii]|nr:hypothetical protein [Flavobacterium collinsii]